MNWDCHLVPALYRIRINHRVEGEDRNCSALLPWKKDPMSAYNATTDLIRSMVPTSSHKIAYRYGTYSNIYIYIYVISRIRCQSTFLVKFQITTCRMDSPDLRQIELYEKESPMACANFKAWFCWEYFSRIQFEAWENSPSIATQLCKGQSQIMVRLVADAKQSIVRHLRWFFSVLFCQNASKTISENV